MSLARLTTCLYHSRRDRCPIILLVQWPISSLQRWRTMVKFKWAPARSLYNDVQAPVYFYAMSSSTIVTFSIYELHLTRSGGSHAGGEVGYVHAGQRCISLSSAEGQAVPFDSRDTTAGSSGIHVLCSRRSTGIQCRNSHPGMRYVVQLTPRQRGS